MDHLGRRQGDLEVDEAMNIAEGIINNVGDLWCTILVIGVVVVGIIEAIRGDL